MLTRHEQTVEFIGDRLKTVCMTRETKFDTKIAPDRSQQKKTHFMKMPWPSNHSLVPICRLLTIRVSTGARVLTNNSHMLGDTLVPEPLVSWLRSSFHKECKSWIVIMSQSRPHGSKDTEEDREQAEDDVKQITAQLKRTHHPSNGRVLPSQLGWKISCPHCGESFTVAYKDDGTFQLAVEE